MCPPQDTASSQHLYTGRFAPSPSGPLHMGSLLAALASYLEARARQGRWLVRIEDLDPPREQAGADRLILATLESLGLHWDGPVVYQSRRHAAYDAALQQLHERGLLFYCRCSRRQLREWGGIYPGTCRPFREPRPDSAIRLRTDSLHYEFQDLFQGRQSMNAANDGDFIVHRRDGHYAYQLAVVVDDAWQGITHIVRGIDLIDNTGRQLYLQQQLGLPTPVYGHIPVIVNHDGQKLSKQHGATALKPENAPRDLYSALCYLRQNPPPALADCNVDDMLDWAVQHWKPAAVAGLQAISEVS